MKSVPESSTQGSTERSPGKCESQEAHPRLQRTQRSGGLSYPSPAICPTPKFPPARTSRSKHGTRTTALDRAARDTSPADTTQNPLPAMAALLQGPVRVLLMGTSAEHALAWKLSQVAASSSSSPSPVTAAPRSAPGAPTSPMSRPTTSPPSWPSPAPAAQPHRPRARDRLIAASPSTSAGRHPRLRALARRRPPRGQQDLFQGLHEEARHPHRRLRELLRPGEGPRLPRLRRPQRRRQGHRHGRRQGRHHPRDRRRRPAPPCARSWSTAPLATPATRSSSRSSSRARS